MNSKDSEHDRFFTVKFLIDFCGRREALAGLVVRMGDKISIESVPDRFMGSIADGARAQASKGLETKTISDSESSSLHEKGMPRAQDLKPLKSELGPTPRGVTRSMTSG